MSGATIDSSPAVLLRRAIPPALTVLCLLTGGCQRGGAEAALEEYVTRLERTLQVDAPPATTEPAPLPPRPGALRLSLPDSSLDALDFLALSGCAVQVTIGKRNSSLGRMAADSQRLLLALEYLRLAPDCILFQRTRGRTGLAATLKAAWRTKREQLPALIFNATLAGTEYRQFWRAARTPGDYPAATDSQVVTALEAVNALARQWLSGDYRTDDLAFEIYLGEVAGGDGGELMRALAQQGAWLDAADTALGRRQQRGPLCAPGTRYRAADILPHVVQRFFVGAVQPHSAALGRRYHLLLPPVRDLETILADTLPRGFLAWQAQRDALLDRLAGAPRRHVERLSALMAPCGGIAAPDD